MVTGIRMWGQLLTPHLSNLAVQSFKGNATVFRANDIELPEYLSKNRIMVACLQGSKLYIACPYIDFQNYLPL